MLAGQQMHRKSRKSLRMETIYAFVVPCGLERPAQALLTASGLPDTVELMLRAPPAAQLGRAHTAAGEVSTLVSPRLAAPLPAEVLACPAIFAALALVFAADIDTASDARTVAGKSSCLTEAKSSSLSKPLAIRCGRNGSRARQNGPLGCYGAPAAPPSRPRS